MKKKTKGSSGFASLMNLKTKPSDYLPIHYERQMTIDDILSRKPVTKFNCNICGEEYDVYERTLNCEFVTWEHDYIRIEQRLSDKLEINSYNVCPKCSTRVLNFIKSIQTTN